MNLQAERRVIRGSSGILYLGGRAKGSALNDSASRVRDTIVKARGLGDATRRL